MSVPGVNGLRILLYASQTLGLRLSVEKIDTRLRVRVYRIIKTHVLQNITAKFSYRLGISNINVAVRQMSRNGKPKTH